MDLYRSQVAALHKRCTLELYSALKSLGLDVAEPQGAFYVYPSFQPFAKQLESLGIKTGAQLSTWLVIECGIAALPGSVFGEKDDGLLEGRFRLRMATSYLYFRTSAERYEQGYDLLATAVAGKEAVSLPLVGGAVEALRAAVGKLNAL